MEIKDLKINGDLYAEYNIDDVHLSIKFLKTIDGFNKEQSEQAIIEIISSMENKKFQTYSYL